MSHTALIFGGGGAGRVCEQEDFREWWILCSQSLSQLSSFAVTGKSMNNFDSQNNSFPVLSYDFNYSVV